MESSFFRFDGRAHGVGGPSSSVDRVFRVTLDFDRTSEVVVEVFGAVTRSPYRVCFIYKGSLYLTVLYLILARYTADLESHDLAMGTFLCF